MNRTENKSDGKYLGLHEMTRGQAEHHAEEIQAREEQEDFLKERLHWTSPLESKSAIDPG